MCHCRTCGMGLLSLAGWLLADWKMIIWVCVSLLGLTYLCYPLVPESPRYLLRTGKVKEAAKVLKTVARVNGKEEPKDLEEKLTVREPRFVPELFYSTKHPTDHFKENGQRKVIWVSQPLHQKQIKKKDHVACNIQRSQWFHL